MILWPLKNLFSNFTGLLPILFYIDHIKSLGGEFMAKINKIKLESLKQTKKFYIWALKYEDLTKKRREAYSLALESIEKIIREKEESGEKRKHNYFSKKIY